MKLNSFDKTIGLTLILGLFLACGNKPKKALPYDYDKAASVFAADESFFPILDEQLEIYNAFQSKGIIKPVYTNEQEAIDMLMKNKTWLAFTTRKLSDNERQSLEARKFKPYEMPLAYDGLAIIVNNSNPDTCITVKDFARILSGEVTKWKELYPKSTLGNIDVVFDNPHSSTVHYCEDSILGGKPITSKNVGAVLKSSEVIDWVEKHPNSLGIIGSNWLNDQRDSTNVTFKKNITVMKVSKMDVATPENSWRPYQYYLYTGYYPLVRTIYAIVSEPRGGVPTGFANFCRLPKGQLIFFKAGLLPIQGNINVRDVNVSQ